MRETELTTPFGRRTPSLGQIATQIRLGRSLEDAAEPGSNRPKAVNKWALFRLIGEAREALGLSDRTLSLLNALLSFHPETALTLPLPEDGACGLVVFPSNRELARRAHGMAEKTIRRHLACLVEGGLIIRRDSPNGKRYARKDAEDGEGPGNAYGFDLTPLVARAAEFETLAEETRRALRRRAALREKISLHRRDIGKLIALGLEEGLAGEWEVLRGRLLALAVPLRRNHDDRAMADIAEALGSLRLAALQAMERALATQNMTGNDGDGDRRLSNSNTETFTDFEPAYNEAGPTSMIETKALSLSVDEPYPLGMVLEACPDIGDYGDDGAVRNWPALLRAARAIRPMLGVSPDAWTQAVSVMGEGGAAVALAVVLQRSEHSSEAAASVLPDGRRIMTVNGSPAVISPGGYLRALTLKAAAGGFTAGPALMALLAQRLKARRARAAAC